jgi:hypothetical protein
MDMRLLFLSRNKGCYSCIYHVEDKTRSAFSIIHIFSLITIIIAYKFKAIRISIEHAKINNIFNVLKNLLQSFEIYHS